MDSYRVTVEAVAEISAEVVIEADSYEEASKKALAMAKGGDLDWEQDAVTCGSVRIGNISGPDEEGD